jgi:hypothetical protein
MYVQELKDRVAHEGYTVDPDAVAAAIWLRWRATQVSPEMGFRLGSPPSDAPRRPGSGEVVEPE